MQPETPTERVALVTRRLLAGERLEAAQVASDYGMSYTGAMKLLQRLSRVLGLVHRRRAWYIPVKRVAEPWN